MISVFFSEYQRELILKYGYPFEELQKQLEKAKSVSSDVKISDDVYWWECLAGDLSISLNEGSVPDRLIEDVNEIAEIVELHISLYKEGS